ncbi:ComEA family DNA-binding protein [Bifidobacterium leontopitheci]|nr:helix-hairpin-helix domain-containing protein [Bifidobacterium leontopitheci]
MGDSHEDGMTVARRLSALDGTAGRWARPGTLRDDASDRLPQVPPPAASPRRVVSMSDLMGVRSADGDRREQTGARTRPRLSFKPVQSLMAVLLLATALCASLTMLVQQSLHYASLGAATARQQPVQAGTVDEEPAGDAANAGVTGDDAALDGDGGGSDGDDRQTVEGSGQNETAGDGTAGVGTRENAATGDGSATAGGAATQDGAQDSSLIDLNSATAAQLDTIPGVGPATAQRILDHRRRIGRFTSVDQLLDVSGIGARTLEKIRPWVRV